eukprot:scaffold36105_cov51-Phaeocystis_antarctica.AAC.3
MQLGLWPVGLLEGPSVTDTDHPPHPGARRAAPREAARVERQVVVGTRARGGWVRGREQQRRAVGVITSGRREGRLEERPPRRRGCVHQGGEACPTRGAHVRVAGLLA